MKIEVEKKDLDSLMLSQIKNPVTDDTSILSNANCIKNYGILYIKNRVSSSSLILRKTSPILAHLSKILVLDNDNNPMSKKFTPGMLLTRSYITKYSKYFTTPDFNSLIIKPDGIRRNNQLCGDVLWISIHGFLGGFMNPDEIVFILEGVIHAIPDEFQEFMDGSNSFNICPVLKDYFVIDNNSCKFIDKYKQFSSTIAASHNCSSTNSQQPLQEPKKSTPVETPPNTYHPPMPDYSTLPISFIHNTNTTKNTNNAPWYNNLISN